MKDPLLGYRAVSIKTFTNGTQYDMCMGECRTALEIFSSELKILYIPVLRIFKPMQSTIHVQLTFPLRTL